MTVEKAHESMKFYRRIEQEWRLKYHVWRAIYWALGAGSIILPAIAAIKPSDSGLFWNFLSAGGAICAALLTFFDAKDRSDRFNAAWVVLRNAINIIGPEKNDVSEHENLFLNKAWNHGDYVINAEIFAKYIPDHVREMAAKAPEQPPINPPPPPPTPKP